MARRLLVLLLLLAAAAPGPSPARDAAIAVIVHPERRAALGIDDVAQIYLRRKRFWEDGAPIVPLNLVAAEELRERFTRVVLRQSGRLLAEYWNAQYFHGVLPPPTLASTVAVRRYVASDPKAIGYVPASEVDGTVRVLLRIE